MSVVVTNPSQQSVAARSRAVSHGAFALADQVLISGANFVALILLARGLDSPTAFGAFVLVQSAFLFANSLQAALITEPHNVLGATRRGDDYARYTSATAWSQLALVLVVASAVLLGWLVARWQAWSFAPLLLAMAPAVIAWQLQEFVRRVLYTEGRTAAALSVDVIGYGGHLATVVGMYAAGSLSGEATLYAMCGASLAAATIGGWLIRDSLRSKFDLETARENWTFGKWLAACYVMGNWFASQFLVYLAAAMLGAGAAGILRAIHTLFGPLRILAQAFSTALPTRFSKALVEQGAAAFRRDVKISLLLTVPVLGLYCLLVAGFSGTLLRLVFGEQYAGNERLLMLAAVASFIGYTAFTFSTTLRALRRTKQIFVCELIATLAIVPVGALLVAALGMFGVVWGMLLTDLLLLYLYRRTYSTALAEHSDVPTSQAAAEAHAIEALATEANTIQATSIEANHAADNAADSRAENVVHDAPPLLPAAGAAVEIEAPRSRWFDALCLLLLGYALFGRGFAYLGLHPLYVGEVVLLSGLFVFFRSGNWRYAAASPAILPLVALAAWSGLITLSHFGEHRFDALRDAMIWGYAAFAVLLMGTLLAEPARLPLLLRRYENSIPLILTITPLSYLLYQLDVVPKWPWADIAIVECKPDDVLTHLAGILAFWVTGLGRRSARGWMFLLLACIMVIGASNRAGLLACILAFAICLAFRPLNRLLWSLVTAGVAALLLFSVTDVRIVVPGNDREFSSEQFAEILWSLTGKTKDADLNSTKQWRLQWWTDIVNYTWNGEHFWTGKGFGLNLADSDGYQGTQWNGKLRSPHNGHLTMLARAGVPGFALWVLPQLVWFWVVLRGCLLSHLAGHVRWNSLFVFLLAYWSALITTATFEVYLEGPVGGVWFWVIYGTGISAATLYRYCPEVMAD